MKDSTITSTLLVDGVEVEDESAEMVAVALAQLRKAYDALGEARQVLARCPEVVEMVWLKEHRAADQKLSKLLGKVSRFEEDYRRRGLESAVSDASFRGDL